MLGVTGPNPDDAEIMPDNLACGFALLGPKSRQRVNFRGAARGNIAGQERDEKQ